MADHKHFAHRLPPKMEGFFRGPSDVTEILGAIYHFILGKVS